MNIWDWVILALVAAALLLAVRRMRKRKKEGCCSGECSCCSDCAGTGAPSEERK